MVGAVRSLLLASYSRCLGSLSDSRSECAVEDFETSGMDGYFQCRYQCAYTMSLHPLTTKCICKPDHARQRLQRGTYLACPLRCRGPACASRARSSQP